MSDADRPFAKVDLTGLKPTRRAPSSAPPPLPPGLDPARLFEVVGEIYATVSDQSGWTRALDGVCDLLGAPFAISGVFDVHRPEVHRHSASRNLSESELFDLLDTATEERLERFVELYELPPQTLMHFPDPVGRPDVKTDGFIRLLRDRFDVHGIVSANANPNKSWFDYVNIFYGRDHRLRDDARDRSVSFLLPHIAKANAARRPLDVLRRKYKAVFGALDRLAFGVVLVDEAMSIIASNAAGGEILEAGDGLAKSRDGRLFAIDEAANAALAASIASVCALSRREGGEVVAHVAAPRRSRRRAYIVEASPFADTSDGEMNLAFRGAMLFCIDPTNARSIDPRGLALVYGLTPAETRTSASLLAGLSNDEIASAQGVAVETVKSHAKALYSKTNTRNRTDYIRLAASISPPLREEPGGETKRG